MAFTQRPILYDLIFRWNLKQTKQVIEKDIRFVARVEGMGRTIWRKVSKKYKLPVMRSVNLRDGMDNVVTITNTAL